jgi:hypothetical protein
VDFEVLEEHNASVFRAVEVQGSMSLQNILSTYKLPGGTVQETSINRKCCFLELAFMSVPDTLSVIRF